jgi:hypothetical protein
MRSVGARTRGSTDPPAAGGDGPNRLGALGRGDERGSGAGAGAEIANRKAAPIRALREPIRGADQPFGQEANVEPQTRRLDVDRFFVGGQQVDQ